MDQEILVKIWQAKGGKDYKTGSSLSQNDWVVIARACNWIRPPEFPQVPKMGTGCAQLLVEERTYWRTPIHAGSFGFWSHAERLGTNRTCFSTCCIYRMFAEIGLNFQQFCRQKFDVSRYKIHS